MRIGFLIPLLIYSVGFDFYSRAQNSSNADSTIREEFKIWRIPNITRGAECYFSPDGKTIIYNGKEADDSTFHVYTINIDGTHRKRINNKGADACSYFNPDGKNIIWTSTKDNLDLPPGNFSDPQNYPQGAELYTSDLNGNNIKRLTNNKVYEAEVTYAPDGHKILFGRQINGEMDLWTMDPDGGNQKQITFTHDWQEGGALYLPDNKTIITRAWKRSEEANRSKSMQLFTLNEDGSNLQQITFEEGTHWAPSPAPDGVHILYVKLLLPHNFEIFLLNLKTMEEKQLTRNPAFDGFPTISPDGKTVAFSSGRENKPGERNLAIYLMDVSSLHLGKENK
jgi:Tol biopolymer transport system component